MTTSTIATQVFGLLGVLDAAAAVARAQGPNGLVVRGGRSGTKLRFQWFSASASRVSVVRGGYPPAPPSCPLGVVLQSCGDGLA